ncbi:uncharacterized protein LOC125775150 isoform X1 [Anopheles funestus]|uniref:uncharacterized protein LOC125775150 isoform X1 n=1 Tax=Anopheles funestus TaxID=62324 RepID=UPI0020C690E1|nr:uncharacterized protein LOC125775150 isoform X1 [Anopheles funestus]
MSSKINPKQDGKPNKKRNKQYCISNECDFPARATGRYSQMLQEVAEETNPMSQEQMLSLISCVERSRCLWDRSDADYKNINRHQDAWEAIGAEMELPYSALKDKWSSLKGSFRHYKTLYDESLVTGSGKVSRKGSSLMVTLFIYTFYIVILFRIFLGSAEIYRPKWFAYRAMEFLNSITDGGIRIDTMSNQIQSPTATSPTRNSTPEPVSIADGPESFNLSASAPAPCPSATDQTSQPILTHSQTRNASAASKRRWHEANLRYNEEVMTALANVAQATLELRSAGSENRLAPLYAGMRDWSPVRQEAMVVKVQSLIAQENVARFVERNGYDPRN